jgi:hypothetical protein
MNPRVKAVKANPDYTLTLTFTNGMVDPKVKTRKPKFKVPFTPCVFNISKIIS